MKKIYVFGIFTGCSSYGVIRDAEPCGDVNGYAVDSLVEVDGKIKMNAIAGHWSSGENWCKYDMGITSNWKHDVYNEKYPDGYELVWLGCFVDKEDAYNLVVNKIQANN